MKPYYLLAHLAKRYRVLLVTFNHDGPATAEQRQAIEALGVEVHDITLRPIPAALASIRTFTTDLPLEIAFYTRPAFAQVVERLLQTEKIDVGISFFMRTAEYLRGRSMHKVLIAEDCRLEYQTRSSNAARTLHQKLVRWWETRKLRVYEPSVVHDFDVTTFVSAEDVRAMTLLEPDVSYAVVTNGVDLEKFAFRDNIEQREGLLFTGKMDVLANDLMASMIIDDVLPGVRAVYPDAILTVAGAYPKPSLRAKESAYVRIEGHVPDIVSYLHNAAVFVHPHHGGSGIQNKVLEAMAAGCPVVTTPSGLQGIDAVHGVHAMVGTDPETLTRHIITLLGDADLRRRLAHNARQLMERTHTWEVVGQQLEAVLAPYGLTTYDTVACQPQPSSSIEME